MKLLFSLALVLAALSVKAGAPYVINVSPLTNDISGNAASSSTLTTVAGLTNGSINGTAAIQRFYGTHPNVAGQTVLGASADNVKDNGTAIGTLANASGTNATAIGYNAGAGPGNNAFAFGSASLATFTDSTAVGPNSATTATNQIMLGAANGTVVAAGGMSAPSFNGTLNLNNPWVTNTLAASNPTFFTNTTGTPICFSIKGTGLIIQGTTVSTYPVGPTLIGATTQYPGITMRTNMVLIITNTTITGNLSWPLL